MSARSNCCCDSLGAPPCPVHDDGACLCDAVTFCPVHDVPEED